MEVDTVAKIVTSESVVVSSASVDCLLRMENQNINLAFIRNHSVMVTRAISRTSQWNTIG